MKTNAPASVSIALKSSALHALALTSLLGLGCGDGMPDNPGAAGGHAAGGAATASVTGSGVGGGSSLVGAGGCGPTGTVATASGAGGASDGSICIAPPFDGLAACAAEVTEGATCDGATLACRSGTSPSKPVIYKCRNLGDGTPLQWTTVTLLETACKDRTATMCPPTCDSESQAANELVRGILEGCLGNESWTDVTFADGCATSFTLSAQDPDHIQCMRTHLETQRYSCAANVTCAGAALSTLQ